MRGGNEENERYEEYITRLEPNGLAAAVKRADLAPSIGGGPTWLEKHYPELYKRYLWALLELGRFSDRTLSTWKQITSEYRLYIRVQSAEKS